MRSVEDQTLIVYHTDLRHQWPQAAALALAARLPYARRRAARSTQLHARASVAGVALALRVLARLLGRKVDARELVFARHAKPRLAGATAPTSGEDMPQCVDFSIAHSGSWVGCAAMAHARIGFDLEQGTDARAADWVAREALLKAVGEGLRALAAVRSLSLEQCPLQWRGASWQLRRLDLFPDASACVVASVPVQRVEVQALTPAELFAP
jgi:phosphopantetheinyl transferase